MAHELGHYFLHYLFQNQTESLVIKREGTNRAESEANWFAEAFLMPAEEFEKEFAESEGYLPSMIYRFQKALELRAVQPHLRSCC
jgi:Zn-dependent peptidase ImmA (M78 family)